ncbi:DUF4097 family beta strand repeat-containing protein [Gracilibacillus dipsosauri]|uniref:DUF4097 family beta strand repeat-containing protein n=1 Tax=Gracilibacillus dipsosauri TaxID=178340 RepID=UPI00240A800A
MTKLKKVLLGAFICIIVGGLGTIFSYRMYAQSSSVETKEINAENIENIKMKVDNQRVEVIPTSGTTIKAELTREGITNSTFTVEEKDDTAEIQIEDKERSFFSFHFHNWKQKLKLFIPEKDYQAITIKVNNGELEMEEVRTTDLEVDTNNGEIDMNHLQTVTSMISTNNGSIHLEDIISDYIQVSTKNGEIEMSDIIGDLKGRTNNGSISLVTSDLDRPIDLETHNGKINIQTEKEPTNVRFDTSVYNGKITILDDTNFSNIIGDGDNLVKLKTYNGSIKVTK